MVWGRAVRALTVPARAVLHSLGSLPDPLSDIEHLAMCVKGWPKEIHLENSWATIPRVREGTKSESEHHFTWRGDLREWWS